MREEGETEWRDGAGQRSMASRWREEGEGTDERGCVTHVWRKSRMGESGRQADAHESRP